MNTRSMLDCVGCGSFEVLSLEYSFFSFSGDTLSAPIYTTMLSLILSISPPHILPQQGWLVCVCAQSSKLVWPRPPQLVSGPLDLWLLLRGGQAGLGWSQTVTIDLERVIVARHHGSLMNYLQNGNNYPLSRHTPCHPGIRLLDIMQATLVRSAGDMFEGVVRSIAMP